MIYPQQIAQEYRDLANKEQNSEHYQEIANFIENLFGTNKVLDKSTKEVSISINKDFENKDNGYIKVLYDTVEARGYNVYIPKVDRDSGKYPSVLIKDLNGLLFKLTEKYGFDDKIVQFDNNTKNHIKECVTKLKGQAYEKNA